MFHGAAVALVRHDGAVLLLLRSNDPKINYPNYWCIPGGHVEEGEDFEKAAKRELKEETKYDAPSVQFLLTESYINDKGKKITRHIYWTKYDGQQELKCLEGQEIKFLLPEEFSKLKMIPGHKRISKTVSKLALDH